MSLYKKYFKPHSEITDIGTLISIDPSYEEEALNSLLHYQDEGYVEINKFLRNNYVYQEDLQHTQDPTLKHIKNIEKLMKTSSSENLVIYRGINKDLITNGKSFIDKGFVSTSLDIDIAFEFSNDKRGVIFTCRIPSEIERINLKNYSEMTKRENEVLLQRNVEFFNFEYLRMYKNVKVYSCMIRPYKLPLRKLLDKHDEFKEELNRNIEMKQKYDEEYKRRMKEMIEQDDAEDFN